MSQIRWLRIFVGGFLSELALFAVFIPATILLGEQPGRYVAVIGSFIMPFFFGIWTTQYVKSKHVLQGMLVGTYLCRSHSGSTRTVALHLCPFSETGWRRCRWICRASASA